jgi:hypothetical protein
MAIQFLENTHETVGDFIIFEKCTNMTFFLKKCLEIDAHG